MRTGPATTPGPPSHEQPAARQDVTTASTIEAHSDTAPFQLDPEVVAAVFGYALDYLAAAQTAGPTGDPSAAECPAGAAFLTEWATP